MALPGGFSKLKGEKVGWKERDPVGYAQAQAELDAKKLEKPAAEAREGGKEKVEKPRHKISDEGMEEEEGDDESPFAVQPRPYTHTPKPQTLSSKPIPLKPKPPNLKPKT